MMHRALFAVFVAASSLTACDPDDGIPAEELCGAIEARSDCASNECITVGCFDGPSRSHGDPFLLDCVVVYDRHSASGDDLVYINAEAQAVAETEADCSGYSSYYDVECAPADTGAVPADMLVGCIDLE